MSISNIGRPMTIEESEKALIALQKASEESGGKDHKKEFIMSEELTQFYWNSQSRIRKFLWKHGFTSKWKIDNRLITVRTALR